MLVEVVVEALFFSEVFECVGDFGAVVAVAGDDTMTTLSPLVFFFLLVEDFDCVGDFGATVVAEAGDFFFESFFFLEDFDCVGDFGATVVLEAGDFFFESFFFLEDFDCVGDFGASAACTKETATAGLALTVPGTVERVRS